MSEWLGPSAPWPRHRYPEAERALSEARHAGWWLRTGGKSAHVFGQLYCRRSSEGESCRFVVFSTGGSDTEQTAHLIRDKIAKCQHGGLEQDDSQGAGESGPAEAIRAAHFHMDRAEHLLASVEQLLAREDFRHRATALIESAVADTAEAEEHLVQASELDDEANRRSETAREEADQADMGGPPWPPENMRARLAEPAEHDLRTADDLLEETRGPDARQATRRLAELRRRLDDCRARMAPETPAD